MILQFTLATLFDCFLHELNVNLKRGSSFIHHLEILFEKKATRVQVLAMLHGACGMCVQDLK